MSNRVFLTSTIVLLYFLLFSIFCKGGNNTSVQDRLDSIAVSKDVEIDKKIALCEAIERTAKLNDNTLGIFQARLSRSNYYLELLEFNNAQLLSSYLIHLVPSAILEADRPTDSLFKSLLAQAHFIHAQANFQLNNGEDILDDLQQTITIYSNLNQYEKQVEIHLFFTEYYIKKKETDSLLLHLSKALDNLNYVNDSAKYIAAYLTASQAYSSIGNALQALLYLDSATSVVEIINEANYYQEIYYIKAQLLTKASKFVDAKALYSKSLALSATNSYLFPYLHMAFASLYNKMEKFDSSYYHANVALESFTEKERKNELPIARIIFSHSLSDLNDLERAMEELNKLSISYLPSDSLFIKCFYHYTKAHIYFKKGKIALSKTEGYTAQSYANRLNGYFELKVDLYEHLIQLAKESNNYTDAFYHAMTLSDIKDSLRFSRKNYEDAFLLYDKTNALQEVEYKLHKSEAIHTKYLKDVKNIQLFLLICIIIGVIFFVFFVLRNKKQLANHYYTLKKRISEQQQTIVQLNKQLVDSKNNVDVEHKAELYRQLAVFEDAQPIQTKIRNQVKSLKTKESYKENILKSLDQHIHTLQSWDQFSKKFNRIFPNFHSSLVKKYTHLTENDIRLCCYLKLELSNKQIASIAAISDNTVKSSLFRLKKKIKLTEKDSLRETIQAI